MRVLDAIGIGRRARWLLDRGRLSSFPRRFTFGRFFALGCFADLRPFFTVYRSSSSVLVVSVELTLLARILVRWGRTALSDQTGVAQLARARANVVANANFLMFMSISPFGEKLLQLMC